VEDYRVVRCRGPHIVQTIGSEMVARLSVKCTGLILPHRNFIFLLLVLISVRGRVNLRAQCGRMD
jgi:hypothetical protein